MDIYWEIDRESEAGHYQKLIRSHCAWCNAWMEKNLERYLQRGNACLPCTTRFNILLNGVRQRTNRGSYIKIREYSNEERLVMMITRLKEVKDNKLDRKPKRITVT